MLFLDSDPWMSPANLAAALLPRRLKVEIILFLSRCVSSKPHRTTASPRVEAKALCEIRIAVVVESHSVCRPNDVEICDLLGLRHPNKTIPL